MKYIFINTILYFSIVFVFYTDCYPQFEVEGRNFDSSSISFSRGSDNTKIKPEYIRLQNQNNNTNTISFWNSATISDESSSFGRDVQDSDIRKELCPEIDSKLFDQYRYDNRYKTCSKVGQRGHCPENMVFLAEDRNDVYGECDCSSFPGQKPMVYYKHHRKCYFVYEQAYCGKAQWLRFSHKGFPECIRNPCPKPGNENLVPYKGDGECVELNKYYKECLDKNEIVSFVPGEPIARCTLPVVSTKAISPVKRLVCKPGSYMNIVGKCQPAFQYTW